MSLRLWACAFVSLWIVAVPGFAQGSWWAAVPFQPVVFIYKCQPTNPQYSKLKTKFIFEYSYFGSVINFSDERGLMPNTFVSSWSARALTQAQVSAVNLPPGHYLNFKLAKQDSGGAFEESNHCISTNILHAAKTVTMGSGFVITNQPLASSPTAVSLIWKCTRQ